MQVATFEVASPLGPCRRLGVRLDEPDGHRLVDVTAAYAASLATTDEPTPRELALLRAPPDMIGWLRAGRYGIEAARAAVAFAEQHPGSLGIDGERIVYDQGEVTLLPPLPRPRSLRDFSIYEEHASRSSSPIAAGGKPYVRGPAWYRTPPYSNRSCGNIGGPRDPIPYPYYTRKLDLELEIGIVIGKAGRNLAVDEAASHIAGYTILIDSTCRDGQEREPFGVTKRKDFHTTIGPWLTTSDAVDPENLACRYLVDNELWYEGHTSAPHSFSPSQLVAYVSDNETIEPGDLIGTGTVGRACSMDLGRWVTIGQRARFEIESLGVLDLEIIAGEHVVDHIEGMDGYLAYDPGQDGPSVPAGS